MHRDDDEPTPAAMATQAAALDVEGRRAVDAEDYAAARVAFERELVLRRELGDTTGIIYGLVHVAWVCRVRQGDAAAARPLLEEALAIAREHSPQHVGVVLGSLADQVLSEGDFASADQLTRESLALLVSITRDAGTMGAILEGLAMAAAGQGEWVRALRLFGAASALREAAGMPQVQPAVVARFDRYLGPARAALGTAAARAAERQGRAMDLNQALEEALADVDGKAYRGD